MAASRAVSAVRAISRAAARSVRATAASETAVCVAAVAAGLLLFGLLAGGGRGLFGGGDCGSGFGAYCADTCVNTGGGQFGSRRSCQCGGQGGEATGQAMSLGELCVQAPGRRRRPVQWCGRLWPARRSDGSSTAGADRRLPARPGCRTPGMVLRPSHRRRPSLSQKRSAHARTPSSVRASLAVTASGTAVTRPGRSYADASHKKPPFHAFHPTSSQVAHTAVAAAGHPVSLGGYLARKLRRASLTSSAWVHSRP